jgi:hypothetical protein
MILAATLIGPGWKAEGQEGQIGRQVCQSRSTGKKGFEAADVEKEREREKEKQAWRWSMCDGYRMLRGPVPRPEEL